MVNESGCIQVQSMVMGVFAADDLDGRSNTVMTSAPKKKWIQHYLQGEEPNGQPDQTFIGEEVGDKLGYTVGAPSIGRQETSSVGNNNGGGGDDDYDDHHHRRHQVASVIQRSGPPPSAYASNGSASRLHGAAFYSYQQHGNSRSPSPARGACNGIVSVATTTHAVSRATGTATSPLHSNGSSVASSQDQRSYQSSPKMPDAEPYPQQPPGAGGYNHNNNNSGGSHHHSSSSSGSFSSLHPSYPRVDDLASRSHRLEEALLRASRKSPPTLAPAPPASSSSSSSSSSTAAAHFSVGNSGRTSADELLELKKRSGAGTREVHNKLEKNRRAHLRECFEFLRKQLPAIDDKKLSNLGILKSALRHIQTLKRKEREYEHTMEKLAREKISFQQRLAALRKEVPSIPGYSSEANSLDLTSVVPVVLHSQQVQMIQQSERDSPLTFANVQAHTIREENHYRMSGGTASSGRTRDGDQESNSGTSTASEGGDVSDRESADAFSSHRRRVVPEQQQPSQQQQQAAGPFLVNGRLASSPVPGSLKRGHAAMNGDESPPSTDQDRPHIKYIRASNASVATHVTSITHSPLPVTTSHPATYVTVVPTTSGGVLELASVPVETREGVATMPGTGTALYHVRHPSTIAFATSAAGHHVQLATPQVLAAHHGVQLLTHGPSLKLLTAGPAAGMAGASVRVIPVSDVSTSLQPLMAVHAASSITGSKNGEEVSSSLLNGAGSAATAGAVFCTPSGVVIPSLVALPQTEGSSSSTTSSYELPRTVTTMSSTHFKHSSALPSNSPTVLSLPNGLIKATVNRSLQTSTPGGVAHVMTPIAVTRSLPLVTNMAVVGQQSKHVAHILTNSSLDKMGLLKSGSIPIIGGQYLTPATSRQLMKPVVVVAAPPSTSPTTQVVASREGSASAASSRPSTPQTKYPPT